MPVEAKPLFRPEVLRLHLRSFELPDDIGDRKAKLAKWAAMIETGEIERHKETQILGEFLTDIFSGVHHHCHRRQRRAERGAGCGS